MISLPTFFDYFLIFLTISNESATVSKYSLLTQILTELKFLANEILKSADWFWLQKTGVWEGESEEDINSDFTPLLMCKDILVLTQIIWNHMI